MLRRACLEKSANHLVTLSSLCGGASELEHVFQFAGKDKVVIAEQLLRACLVQMSEEDLGFDHNLVAAGDATPNGGAFGTQVQYFHHIHQLFAG